jgi:DNA-binding transcriptional regulator PaaX
MPGTEELAEFIRSHFRSVWSLELLLHLKRDPERAWSTAELVEGLKASQRVVATSLENLVAGGLIVMEGEDRARYGPAGGDLARLMDETEAVYAKKADAVRRLIVRSAASELSAFADAFRLRRD